MSVRPALRFWTRDLWEGARSEPGRVGLSFLAVAIGFTALTLLLAVLDGLRARAQDLVRELGANVMAVLPAPREGDAAIPLLRTQGERLALQLPECRVSALRRYEVGMPADKSRVTVLATDEFLLPLRGWTLEAGRNLDRRDVQEGARHVVISSALARRWKAGIGSLVSLEQTSFRVVGIAALGGGGLEQETVDTRIQTGEQVVLLPHSAPVAWGGESREEIQRADAIFVQVPPDKMVADVLPVARELLDDAGKEGLSWITPDILLRGVHRWQNAVRLAGGSIALLCLVLGGTTLMSLMLANVRDRLPEIGLRRALGATRRDIARLFTVEACLVTGLAAVAGMGLAGLLVEVIRRRFGVPLQLGAAQVLWPLGLAVALGIVFSYWPARLAAHISPAEALRNE
ncbi:MAG: ABC transporter permease [Verrucomicrobia bacterium]|nr:ABC transporter permease [Verrucomicrobiota bacterium]